MPKKTGKELKDLVASLKLCKQIPGTLFSDSALVWQLDGGHWYVNAREFDATCDCEYPAPTVEEVLDYVNDVMGCTLHYDELYPCQRADHALQRCFDMIIED